MKNSNLPNFNWDIQSLAENYNFKQLERLRQQIENAPKEKKHYQEYGEYTDEAKDILVALVKAGQKRMRLERGTPARKKSAGLSGRSAGK